MIDVESFFHSLKAGWVKKMVSKTNVFNVLGKYFLERFNLTVNQIFMANIRRIEKIEVFQKIPKFYREVIIAFNLCKDHIGIKDLRSHELYQQIIWLNDQFQHKEKYLMFKSWIQSNIIYVKQLYDDNGEFKTESSILNLLEDRTNWIAEYTTIKKVFKSKIDTKRDKVIVRYVNVKENVFLKHSDTYTDIYNVTSNMLYNILVAKKFVKPYQQNAWERFFGLGKGALNWKRVYEVKVKYFPDKKIAEFNYKLLLDKLPNGKRLMLWKKIRSDICLRCNEPEDTEHLLFKCPYAAIMWKRIENILKIQISWKRLILGFQETTQICIHIERLLGIILYLLFKNWVIIRNDGINPSNRNLILFIKSELALRQAQQQYMENKVVKYNLIEKLLLNLL